MSVVVGTLTIDLKANTASFSQSMDKMSQLSAKTANDVKRSLEKIAAAGVALATGVAAATATLIETSVNTIGSLSRLAQASGTTVEQFSALAYAARVSHVETDDLAKAMEKLSKAAFGAQNGNAGLQRIFSRLGIEVADSNHHLKDSSVLFSEVAVKFSGMANGAGKTALAMLLFGKAGAAMIPMLNELGKHQARLTQEAQRFGLVIGGDTAAKAHQYHEVLTQLHAAQMGFGIQLTAAVLPALLKLSERLQELGKDFDIPKLAQEFGAKVTAAVNAAGVALEFAVKHAHALKLALEALAGLQLAKIAIPFLAEITSGTLLAGVGKLTTSLLGIRKIFPLLETFGKYLQTTAWMVKSLIVEEGIATGASYALGEAVAAMGGPVGIAIGAIVGLVIACFKFRDATFSIGKTTYELRDIWSAAWIVMGNVFTGIGNTFNKVVAFMKSVWESFIKLISGNIIVKTFEAMFTGALAFARKMLGAMTPQFLVDALNQAKTQRESAARKPAAAPAAPDRPELPPAETEGLGAPKKEKKDLYSEEVIKLVELVNAQKAYLGVLDASPEKIAAVASAEKANGVILALNTRLLDEKRAALTPAEKAAISYLVALEESTKALDEYGKTLVSEQHGADLATKQTTALGTATLQSNEAVREATISNAILALTYNRTADELKKMGPELEKLKVALAGKQTAEFALSLDREIKALQDEVAMKRISVNAAGQFVDAQRNAALAVKLYALNQELATVTDKDALAALEKKKQLITELTKAEWAEEDAKASIALRSPIEKYQEEINALSREVTALEKAQGGTLTYSQSLQVAERAQDAFNKATDETVSSLLRFGGLRDGVDAFFLDMQKSAQSAASIIYTSMHDAFSKLSDQLAALVTGGKTSFAKMAQDIGKQLVNSSIKAGLQSGIGAVGKAMGIDLKGLGGGKKPDGTKGNPLWVQMAKDAGLGGVTDAAGGALGAGTDDDGANPTTGMFSALKGVLGKLLGGLMGGVTGGGGFAGMLAGALADGGDMLPGKAYLVGENGPEVRRGNHIISNSASRRMLDNNASNHYYTIDARGTDPVLTEQRTRAAIIAAHNSAIGKSLQVQQEHVKRNPQR